MFPSFDPQTPRLRFDAPKLHPAMLLRFRFLDLLCMLLLLLIMLAAAYTVQVGTLVAVGTRTLAAGDRLAVDYADAIQASEGVVVTACMAPQ